MSTPNYEKLSLSVGKVFTPGAPVNVLDLFAGRREQISSILDAVSQRGFHAVLYGDRGVGKTSLANVLSFIMRDHGEPILFLRTNCDSKDTFSSLWKKIFDDLLVARMKHAVGFNSQDTLVQEHLLHSLPVELRPDDVRRVLTELGQGGTVVVALDEFDRLQDRTVPNLTADTIKALSDSGAPATLLLIGVADSVDQLIESHRSVERALVQIPMPRMSKEETEQIVLKGIKTLGMQIDFKVLSEIAGMSQGLPYVTHMVALYSVRAALIRQSLIIGREDVQKGIAKSLEQWQQSIISAYHEATKSHQPDHLYREVLLACALAEADEKSFFTAAAVRTPLRAIARPNLDIPNFARHLKEFSETRRGKILQREGENRRLRYRFVSPLMRPYIIMRGVSSGLLSADIQENLVMADERKQGAPLKA